MSTEYVSAVGVYDQLGDAEAAVKRLEQGGFPVAQVSVVSQSLENDERIHGYVAPSGAIREGAAGGAWLGGLFGLLAGAAFLWIPGFGPLLVAGPLAALLAAGVEGAVAGSLLGGLAAWGISRDQLERYEEMLKSGKHLLIAHGSHADVERVRELLGSGEAAELKVHV